MRKPVQKKNKQESFLGLKPQRSDHGGSLRCPQKRKRPLGFRSTTHLVLRSSQAKGSWSFLQKEQKINAILDRFAKKNYIHILNRANVGNHIHLHLRISNRKGYVRFIRAITAAISMAVTGYNQWNKSPDGFKFWDQRPFSRIVSSWKEFINLKSYIEINRWESLGADQDIARDFVKFKWIAPQTVFL